MKIITVTMVKNEENIIESFVRHAMTFSDNVIVYNHNSTDGTLQILEALKKEYGSRFMIFPELMNTAMTINQEVFNQMVRYAFDEMNADMVLPLDSDEFPVLVPKGNLRNYLEALDSNKCYRAHFMPFSLPEKWEKETFAPLQFKRRKTAEASKDYKIFIQREPYYRYGLVIGLGNHVIVSTKEEAEVPTENLYPRLFYAHLAFRNKEHLESKLVIRWLSLIMRTDIDRTSAFQYREGYTKILQGKQLSKEEVDWFCLNNMCAGIDNVETYKEIQEAVEEVDTSTLFEPLQLKYTNLVQAKSNYILLMEFAQQVIEQYKEQKQIIEPLHQKAGKLEQDVQMMQEELQRVQVQLAAAENECQTLKDNLQGIRSSKAWKLIQLYRKIAGKHDPAQD